jgi:hypothetical protein
MGTTKRKSDYNDAPARINLVQSVRDMRKVHSDMTDIQFIDYYRRKYRTGLLGSEIQKILDHDKKKAEQQK